MISTIDPVKGANNSNLFCGQNAQVAAYTAPAKPGSNVTFQWSGAPGGNDNVRSRGSAAYTGGMLKRRVQQWPHNVGPIMSYMTACGSDDCSTFNSSAAEWFKIAELGMNSSNTWYQGYLSRLSLFYEERAF